MAGSRLDKIGTIFSRASGLLKSGAVKYQDRPIWYDIYRVFPPKYEPFVDREPKKKPEEIPNILYKEDRVRAEFFKQFGLNPDGKPRRLKDHTFEDPSQDFVSKFMEFQKSNPDSTFDQAFQAAAEQYQVSKPFSFRQRREGEQTPSFEKEFKERGESMELDDAEILENRRRRRTTPLITAESLRSLFEEAKNNQQQKDKKSSQDSENSDVDPKKNVK